MDRAGFETAIKRIPAQIHGLNNLVKGRALENAVATLINLNPNTTMLPDRFDQRRNVVFLDTRYIMESSGEPVPNTGLRFLSRGVRNRSWSQERQPTWDTAHSFRVAAWRVEACVASSPRRSLLDLFQFRVGPFVLE